MGGMRRSIRCSEITTRQHGLISRRQVLAEGGTDTQIRVRVQRGEWVAVWPGVYRPAGMPRNWKQDLLAACLGAEGRAVASHRSAGALWELPGCEGSPPEVTLPHGQRYRRPGIAAHQSRALLPVELTEVDGIPTTRPTRTVIDLAAVITLPQLEIVLEEALRRGIVHHERLRRRLEILGRHGRPGSRKLLGLLIGRGPQTAPTESVLETEVLQALRVAGLPIPVRQHWIAKGTRVVARADFAYVDARVAIEADSYGFHGGRDRFEHDLRRRNQLLAMGWTVVHVTKADVRNGLRDVLPAIAAAIAARSHESSYSSYS